MPEITFKETSAYGPGSGSIFVDGVYVASRDRIFGRDGMWYIVMAEYQPAMSMHVYLDEGPTFMAELARVLFTWRVAVEAERAKLKAARAGLYVSGAEAPF